jgi:hypothetical protein
VARRLAVLLFLCLIPDSVLAGPYLGEWDWMWHPDRDCPRGEYSPLHYWVPGYYWVRRNVHPSNLDQFPSGPDAPVNPNFEFTKYRCPSAPPVPSDPYSDPSGYYGRPGTPAN